MICPNCQYACGESDHYCACCGLPLNAPEKKGRHWVPILAMVLMCVIGIGLFFAIPYGSNTGVNSFTPDDMPWFTVNDGVLYFSEAHYDGESELTVPETIGGATVTALSEGCFQDCTELTAVFLPDTLLAIGEDAFRGCTALRGIELPESVQVVGQRAFASCTALEAAVVNGNVRTIGDHAFSDCHKLRYIYFLGEYAAWAELYDGFITPSTTIFCDDGSYYQGDIPN